MTDGTTPRRIGVAHSIYMQPNGNFAVAPAAAGGCAGTRGAADHGRLTSPRPWGYGHRPPSS